MRINNNIMALNSHRHLSINQAKGAKAMEKLSSGFRINHAGDDVAGLAISEKMRAQIRGLKQADRNARDGISLIQVAEGALNETHSIMQRIRELAVQSATDTNINSERAKMQKEVDQLAAEITKISNTTEFNSKNLLAGGLDNLFHVGANQGQNMGLTINPMDAHSLGLATSTLASTIINNSVGIMGDDDVKENQTSVIIGDDETNRTACIYFDFPNLTADEARVCQVIEKSKAATVDTQGNILTYAKVTAGIDISTQAAADAAITTIDNAIGIVSAERSKLGAMQNRLEYTIANLGTAHENLQAAESRIRDSDMAAEMMAFTRNSILQQIATSILAQANMAPQSVLQLLTDYKGDNVADQRLHPFRSQGMQAR